MSLREIARYTDVYEAELASAFLADHGIDALVTERFQTTIDPLMQRALGIRLMAPASLIPEARALLARVQAGEFATAEDRDPVEDTPRARLIGAGAVLALFIAGGGLFWGTSGLRRMRAVHWAGLALVGVLLLIAIGASVWSYVELRMFYAGFFAANS